MIKELSTVVLTHDLEEYGLKQGDIGAIVHTYSAGNAYEVEFVTGSGETIAVATLHDQDVRLIGGEEILHVRTVRKQVA